MKKNKFITGAILFLSAGIFLFSAQVVSAQDEKGRKILYYRNPMNPSITSPTFMKDSMGMDYIPVYAEEEAPGAGEAPVVKVSLAQQQLIGVQAEPVVTRPLMRMVRTVAKIAFDPELYKAQQEFIEAYRAKEALRAGEPEVIRRLEDLFSATQFKLKLQGLSDNEIEALKSKAESDRSLLISDSFSPYAWAYLTIYEYDLPLVKAGDRVILNAIAYPGEEFSGIIKSIDPVLDMNTRSVRARAAIGNPEGKLKPNMYADALIHIDLGEKLALPREAVLDTGLRKVVYIDLGKGEFRAQEVEIGPEAESVVDGQGRRFFPVLKGLRENEVVVTNGNFLIDSQSQLSGGMSALWGGATEIKQQESQSQESQKIDTQHRH